MWESQAGLKKENQKAVGDSRKGNGTSILSDVFDV